MTNKKFIVVVYDISNDKRRTKLHNKLKGYGSPVQYSVFECILTPSEFQEMKMSVSRITKPKKDHIRFYVLCAMCREKIEIVGREEVTTEPTIVIV